MRVFRAEFLAARYGQFGSASISLAIATRSACPPADDRFRLRRLDNGADSHGRDPGLSADRFGIRHQVARRDARCRQGGGTGHAAGRASITSMPVASSRRARAIVSQIPSLLQRRRRTRRDRIPACRPARPNARPGPPRAKPHAPLQRAAVLVAAPVGDRRKERMEQVAVRAVNLHDVESRLQRSSGRAFERADQIRDFRFRQFPGRADSRRVPAANSDRPWSMPPRGPCCDRSARRRPTGARRCRGDRNGLSVCRTEYFGRGMSRRCFSDRGI